MNIQSISLINDKIEYINIKNVEIEGSLVKLHETQYLQNYLLNSTEINILKS